MAHDISNNVVAVLLVLVIVIAAFGTWAFLTEFESVDVSAETGETGEVRLDIGEQPRPPTGQGEVRLDITEAS